MKTTTPYTASSGHPPTSSAVLAGRRALFNGRGAGLTALTLSSALALSACGSSDEGDSAADNGQGNDGGTLRAYACEPQNLQPGNNTENCGARILQQLFTGITEIDHETNEPVGAVANSWETEDQITWTFELSGDYTFHNGDPVTAQSFVESWNWVADPENAQAGATFMNNFLGYEEVVEGDAEELEGVRAIDDTTLEIELVEPFGQLPNMLTYSSFYPMPEVAFEDMNAFQDAPIGNGRYAMDGEWVRGTEVLMDRYEDWAGEEPGSPQRIEWQIYSDTDTAYLDVQAGNLDVLGDVPPSRLATVESDFGENSSQHPTSRLVYIGLPLYQEEFQDIDIRRALSMAMDRDEINDSIFDGNMTPAQGILPPVLPMAREDACGDSCQFDPAAAEELYEAAGGPSEITLYTDSGSGHEEYVEAIGNQWMANLPIDSVNYESLEFPQYLDLLNEDQVEGPFRLGWLLAYPSPQYAMQPLYSTGASSNHARYSSEEFDTAIEEANAASPEDADALYQAAEDILLADLPVLPLFFQDYFVVHTDRVENVYTDVSAFVRVEDVVVLD